MIRTAAALACSSVLAVACSNDVPTAPASTKTVTVTASSDTTPTASPTSPVGVAGDVSPATMAQTRLQYGPRIFSVSNPESTFPPLQPGDWISVYVGAPHARPPAAACNAWQWAGSNKQDIVGLWGTPVGEPTLRLVVEDVQGFIELQGECNWELD